MNADDCRILRQCSRGLRPAFRFRIMSELSAHKTRLKPATTCDQSSFNLFTPSSTVPAINGKAPNQGCLHKSFPALSNSTIEDGGAISAIPFSLTCEPTRVVLPTMVRARPDGS